MEDIAFDFSSHFNAGSGSDQCPMTWANDDHLYSIWGDGWGWCECGTKMSMGVTRISGLPAGLSGTDVWGDVSVNRKLLIIADAGGLTYLFWTTNQDGWDGSYGAASTDNGQSWTFDTSTVSSYAADGVRVVVIAQFGPGYTNLPSSVDPDYFYVYLSGWDAGRYLDVAIVLQ